MVAPELHLNLDLSRPLTPLKVDVFETELTRYDLLAKYPDLLEYLRNGFPIGKSMPEITSTIIRPNHFKNEDLLKIIRDDFEKELQLGRLIGPFDKAKICSLLGGHFRTSPVGVKPKPNKPGEYRVIRDLSAPYKGQPSVNDLVGEDPWTRNVNFEEFMRVVSA